jgi:CRP/FNR family transcriptional regulator, cyclic AMP receptor protein
MQTNVSPVMTLESLRSVPLFASLDDEAARALRDLLEVRVLAAGTMLFNAGDAGDAMYLIEAGRVRIFIVDEDGNEVTLTELAGGDFFGEMAIVDGKPRSAAAAVSEQARLAVLKRADFINFVRRNPDVALEMVSAISQRLRRTDELLRQRASRNVNEEADARLTLSDRMADLIAEFGGSWKFIIFSISFLLFWVGLNTLLLRDKGFDPFPYVLLNLVLGMITGLQAPIIMMSQNRQGEKDRLRADLDYQVNLKNELSLAELLRRLDVLESERLPTLFAEQNEQIRKATQKQLTSADGAGEPRSS